MNPAELERRLLEDPVGNVMALKFLSLLGDASEGGFLDEKGRWATWFYYLPQQFGYDAKTYPDQKRIVYWNANDAGAAQTSLSKLPAGLIKVSSEPCLSMAERLWPLRNSYRWFSSASPLTPLEGVREFSMVDESFVALAEENGYSREALARNEARGCRWFTAPAEDPQALCFIQPNFGSIWEVSGVLVREEYRGRGLAKAVVTAAVNAVLAAGLMPRYFVHDENTASLGVARSLGLVEKGRTLHFAHS